MPRVQAPNKRSTTVRSPEDTSGELPPTHHNWRKTAYSTTDPAQQKVNKKSIKVLKKKFKKSLPISSPQIQIGLTLLRE